MRRLAIMTAAAGLALTIGLAAQTGEAHAMVQQCTGNEALTLNPDGTMWCGSTEVSITETTLDGVQVTIQANDPSFAELVPEGGWVEVELVDESAAVTTDLDGGQLLAASATDTKNTAEVAAVVGVSNCNIVAATSYAHTMIIQNQPRGRSDPAPPGLRTAEAWGQAISRFIGDVRRAIIPSGHRTFRQRTFHPNGQLASETYVHTEIN